MGRMHDLTRHGNRGSGEKGFRPRLPDPGVLPAIVQELERDPSPELRAGWESRYSSAVLRPGIASHESVGARTLGHRPRSNTLVVVEMSTSRSDESPKRRTSHHFGSHRVVLPDACRNWIASFVVSEPPRRSPWSGLVPVDHRWPLATLPTVPRTEWRAAARGVASGAWH